MLVDPGCHCNWIDIYFVCAYAKSFASLQTLRLQMRGLTDHLGQGIQVIQNMLFTLRKFEDQKMAAKSQVTSVLKPLIIDLGKHVILQPSKHGRNGQLVSLQQLTPESLYHQAYITGLHSIPSLCCVQPPFWLSPGARAFCSGTPDLQVVMVFSCFADYQSIFQPGMQKVAEAAVERYKACVLQALDLCGGYECQEVNAVYMLAFSDPTAAIKFHLVLQQLLLTTEWTPDMLRLPPMQPKWSKDGTLLFLGPRVKTGIYQGHPRTVNTHSTTGRADYWGELVNRAARMMGAARGGQMLCTGELVSEVRFPVLCTNTCQKS
jgi:hypothetical protein